MGRLLPPLPATPPALRGVLHLVAFPVSIITGVTLVLLAGGTVARATSAIYAVTCSVLFGVSALYHRGRWSPPTKALLQRLDHSNIFLLIAGTYTPVAALLLTGTARIVVLAVVWGGALAGVICRVAWRAAPTWLFVPVYIGLGWVAVGVLPEIVKRGGAGLTALLVIGGVCYTIGATVIVLRRPNPWPQVFGFHEVFHTLTLGGFATHYAAVLLLVAAAR